MSVTDDLKGYADAAVETGRSAVNDGIEQGRTAVNERIEQGRSVVNERITTLRESIDETIDGAGERAGKFAETATGTGTQVLDRARLDAFAAVGAVDAVVTGLVTRLQEFPNDVAGAVAKVQNSTTDTVDRIQGRVQRVFGDTFGTAEQTVSDVRTGAIVDKARERAETYRQQAEERRADLAARGEAVVTELRQDPRVQRVAGLVGQAAVTVEDVAAKPSRRRAAEKAQETRARNERSARAKKAASTRARKTAAPKKTAASTKTATRSTARKSSASKATATS